MFGGKGYFSATAVLKVGNHLLSNNFIHDGQQDKYVA